MALDLIVQHVHSQLEKVRNLLSKLLDCSFTLTASLHSGIQAFFQIKSLNSKALDVFFYIFFLFFKLISNYRA